MTNLQALLIVFAILVLAFVFSTKEVNIQIQMYPTWEING